MFEILQVVWDFLSRDVSGGASLAIAPALIFAAGAATSMLGKKSKGPKVNIAGLNDLVQGNAQKKREIIGGLNPMLQPLSQQYERKQGQIGSDFVSNVAGQGQQYLKDVEETGKAKDTARFNLAQEQTFRQLPQVQQAIRESLAGTGGLGRGYAITELAKAPLQAAQNLSDLTKELTISGAERRGQALDRVYQTNTGAQLNKLGIDKDTANTLLETGRSDVLTQAAQLLGVEDQLTEDLLGIQQLAVGNEFARSGAANQNQNSIIQALGQLIGSYAGKGAS